MSIKKREEPAVELHVHPSDDVRLSIEVGNAQIGGSIIRFDDGKDIIAKGEINDIMLGDGAHLVGKTIRVTTNVLDSNPDSNKISVRHIYKHCDPSSYTYTDELDHSGEVLSLVTRYSFV
jgi:hypothetical protein